MPANENYEVMSRTQSAAGRSLTERIIFIESENKQNRNQ